MKSNHNNDEIVMGFWDTLPKEGSVILAPMADVTDCAFRKVIAQYSRAGEPGGGPDAFYTEFVAADGLASEEGRPRLLHNFKYSEQERPIMAQIFSSSPENMEAAARLCVDLGFDGIDINMGCPERNICNQGAGSALIKDPEQAQAVIKATIRGAEGRVPVSVKTRVGWNTNEIETWIPAILECNVAAILLHGRTRKAMSKVPANWEWIARAADIIRASGKPTKFIGNGDIQSLTQAHEYIKRYKVDGVLVARGIFGNPWFFDREKHEVSVREKLMVMLEHTKIFCDELGEHKNFAVMKKHYKAYIHGFDGAKELRIHLMDSNSYDEIEQYTHTFLEKHPEVAASMIPC